MDDGPPMQDRRRSRLTRLAGFGLLAIASSVAAIGLLLPLAVRVFVRAIELTLSACVRLATSLSVGVSVWTVLRVVARNAVSLVVSGQATVLLIALVVIGI